MRSPPTSRASDARSSVVVTTFSFASAAKAPAPRGTIAATRSADVSRPIFMGCPLIRSRSERVRAMRPDRELHLQQQFVGRLALRVPRPAVHPAQLAELARPERDDHR